MRHSKTSQEKQSHRILKVIFTVIVFALLALYVLMPATVGIFALMRHPSEVGAPDRKSVVLGNSVYMGGGRFI